MTWLSSPLYHGWLALLAVLKNDKLLKCLFKNYCRFATGQGRLIFDEQDPKMSGTQFLKVCEDMGCISPVGKLMHDLGIA